MQEEDVYGLSAKIFVKEEEADKLFGKKNSREDVSEKWSQVKSGNIYQWGDSGRIIFLFGESSGNIQEHLLSTYKDKNTDLKYKYLVTRSSKINPAKVLDLVIAESKPLFWLSHDSDYSHVLWNHKPKIYYFVINEIYR